MPRNLERRVEVTVPVGSVALRTPRRILATSLEDDVLAWELGADGAWTKVETVRGVNLHERLMQEARERVETDDPGATEDGASLSDRPSISIARPPLAGRPFHAVGPRPPHDHEGHGAARHGRAGDPARDGRRRGAPRPRRGPAPAPRISERSAPSSIGAGYASSETSSRGSATSRRRSATRRCCWLGSTGSWPRCPAASPVPGRRSWTSWRRPGSTSDGACEGLRSARFRELVARLDAAGDEPPRATTRSTRPPRTAPVCCAGPGSGSGRRPIASDPTRATPRSTVSGSWRSGSAMGRRRWSPRWEAGALHGRGRRGAAGVLGEHQDAVVAIAWLSAHALATDDPAVAFTAGRLAEHESSRRERPAPRGRDLAAPGASPPPTGMSVEVRAAGGSSAAGSRGASKPSSSIGPATTTGRSPRGSCSTESRSRKLPSGRCGRRPAALPDRRGAPQRAIPRRLREPQGRALLVDGRGGRVGPAADARGGRGSVARAAEARNALTIHRDREVLDAVLAERARLPRSAREGR